MTSHFLYRHFKGGLYVEIMRGKSTDTQAELVIYRPIDKPEEIWVRHAVEFDGMVVKDGVAVKRFELIREYLPVTMPEFKPDNLFNLMEDFDPCSGCGCNPRNGGGGICNCTLGNRSFTS